MDTCTFIFNIASLAIGFVTMICSIIMVKKGLQSINGISLMLEITKHHIYMKYFHSEERRNPKYDSFKDAVRETYAEINKLIPGLSQIGFMQEDWLMAKWLEWKRLNRIPKDTEIRPLAEYISKIRENKL